MSGLVARFPFASALIGIALLTGMDSLVKALSGTYPTFQIVLTRFAITVLLLGAVVVMLGQAWPRRERLPAHLGRAVLMVITASSFFYALGKLPLAELFALSFTSPIFIAVFAALFLKEPVDRLVAVAIGLGFLGMLVIAFGTGAGPSVEPRSAFALACALLAPVTYALSVVLLRAQTAQEPITVIVTVQGALVVLLLAPVVAVQFTWPTGADWAVYAALGLLGTAGYLAFAGGLKHMTAARFGLVEYTGLLWAALIGYVFFSETPALTVWIGAALIIAGCLIAVRQRTAGPKPIEPDASATLPDGALCEDDRA